MNTRSLLTASFGLLLTGVVGCGQGYTPSPDEHIADPRGGGNVFTNGSDSTPYKTASYDILRSTLVDTMGVVDTTANATECPAAAVAAAQCPKYQPISYLAANKVALGAPIYNQADPLQTQAPGPVTTGGFKAWVLASTSASGLMMQSHPEKLFIMNGTDPDLTNFDLLYQTLLGRMPTADENVRLTQVANDIAAVPANAGLSSAMLKQRQGAAITASVLASMEFLMVN